MYQYLVLIDVVLIVFDGLNAAAVTGSVEYTSCCCNALTVLLLKVTQKLLHFRNCRFNVY